MSILTKTCKTCLKEKELNFFQSCKSCDLGVISECRFCSRIKNKPWNLPPADFKKCNDCKNILPKEMFCRDKRIEDGIDRCCKSCVKKRAMIRGLKPKLVVEYKKCNRCKKSKNIFFFHRKINTSDGYSTICKECRKPATKKYNLENKDKIKIFNAKYRESHDLSKKRAEYYKKRNLVDPIFKFRGNVRALILHSFKSRKKEGINKPTKTEAILGCSVKDFIVEIENLFSVWMTWGNRGNFKGGFKNSWDLDHIIPTSAAKTLEEVLLLNHWSNFQPMCSRENRCIKRDDVYPVCNLILNITIDQYGNITKTRDVVVD